MNDPHDDRVVPWRIRLQVFCRRVRLIDPLAPACPMSLTWRRDSVAFVEDVLGFVPDAWQRDALRRMAHAYDEGKTGLTLRRP